ncbi:hypothetical protein WICPIJ_008913 [Wickerhamomyces pijperi]|uniref:Uncharacterized protein n=1 Tax=Wickerhamomyces pijperi TaxID=599730 RepID=A0A9P8PTL3_WICPI|nr:hypothetical protein WICPIJ_008913 [Wickerhamomyces pijperi]
MICLLTSITSSWINNTNFSVKVGLMWELNSGYLASSSKHSPASNLSLDWKCFGVGFEEMFLLTSSPPLEIIDPKSFITLSVVLLINSSSWSIVFSLETRDFKREVKILKANNFPYNFLNFGSDSKSSSEIQEASSSSSSFSLTPTSSPASGSGLVSKTSLINKEVNWLASGSTISGLTSNKLLTIDRCASNFLSAEATLSYDQKLLYKVTVAFQMVRELQEDVVQCLQRIDSVWSILFHMGKTHDSFNQMIDLVLEDRRDRTGDIINQKLSGFIQFIGSIIVHHFQNMLDIGLVVP